MRAPIDKAKLEKTYHAVRKKIAEGDIPTLAIGQNQVIYRWIDPSKAHTALPMPPPGSHVSKAIANRLLIPAPVEYAGGNRFNGPGCDTIAGAEAIYFALQQQALVNEATHYSDKAPYWALAGQCVLRVRTMGRLLVAELSPHNPAGLRFLKGLGPKTWDEMNDPDDVSVARGIGLAIAHSGHLVGLVAQTARESDRAGDERGDNLILFGASGRPIPQLYIDQASFFGKRAAPVVFPVAFP